MKKFIMIADITISIKTSKRTMKSYRLNSNYTNALKNRHVIEVLGSKFMPSQH